MTFGTEIRTKEPGSNSGGTTVGYLGTDGQQYNDALGLEKKEVSGVSIGSDSTAINDLAKKLGLTLDKQTVDYLTQYYLNEQSSKNAYNRELQASSSQYQRAVADLKKAGLNPFLAFDSLRGGSASSSSGSVSGGLYTSQQNTKTQVDQQKRQSALQVLGIIAAAVIYALA